MIASTCWSAEKISAVSLTFNFNRTHSLQLGGPFFQLNFRLAGVVCPDADPDGSPGVDVADIPSSDLTFGGSIAVEE